MNVRLLSVCWTGCLFASQVAFGQDAGLIVVIGETPEPVEFRVPENSPYKFQYDPARITLWDTIDMQNTIPPDTVFPGGPAEPGCEVDLSDFASFQTCFSGDGGGVAPGCDGFDEDADNDVDLEDYVTFLGTFIGPVCNVVFVPVFVEGLVAATGLADTVVTLLTDPDGDGTFTVEATQPVTVVSIDISPPSGGLGTELTVTLQPGIPPLTFTSVTTADWEGMYQPMVGPPTAPFQIAYDTTQFRESSASQAVLVVGDGTVTNAPPFADFESPGSVSGTFVFNLTGMTLHRTVVFGLDLGSAGVWEAVHYPDGPGGLGRPSIAGEWGTLPVLLLSNTPDPLNPDEALLLAVNDFHVAPVVRIEGTATTSLVYSNTTSLPAPHFPPGASGAGYWVTDNIFLNTGPGGCDAVAYEVALYGGGGPDYEAYVELFALDSLFDPATGNCVDTAPAGTGIPGTAMSFSGLPGGDVSYLFVSLDTALPRDLWVYLSVSTNEAGWIIAAQPEIGGDPVISDCFGYNNVGVDCGACFIFTGGLFASFGAEFYCTTGPETPSGDAPATLLVDLVSFDPGGVEIDRVEDLILYKVVGDDVDPDHVVYHNDLDKPIVIVDVDLDEAQYPNVIPFRVVDGGSATIVAATN